MTRLSTLIWMLVIVVAAFLLYEVKYEVQSLKSQVAETSHRLEAEKEAMHVVAAEWAYLNRPQRLQQLAAKYLASSEVTVDKVADIQAIPFPTQAQASLAFDDVKPAARRQGSAVSIDHAQVIIKESTGRRIIEQSRVRLWCVGLFFLLCFASISWRMIDVAIVGHKQAMTITVTDPDSEKSEQMALQSTEPVLQRGDIVDRNGMLLATSLMTASLFANPKEIRDPEESATRLGKTLGMDGKQAARQF